jgi:hypothetical protein
VDCKNFSDRIRRKVPIKLAEFSGNRTLAVRPAPQALTVMSLAFDFARHLLQPCWISRAMDHSPQPGGNRYGTCLVFDGLHIPGSLCSAVACWSGRLERRKVPGEHVFSAISSAFPVLALLANCAINATAGMQLRVRLICPESATDWSKGDVRSLTAQISAQVNL